MRPVALKDVPEIFTLAADPQIARYTSFFGQALHTSQQETRDFIERCLKMPRGEYGMAWVILEKYNNAIIGMISLFGYSTVNRKAEFGYALSPTHWGHGIMTEVSKALIMYAFTELNLVRLQATVDPENGGSTRVLKKCGLKYEGLLHNYYIVNDACCDRAMYALTQEAFLNLAQS
jgi:ribosomal-protein-alanine N-acetyltransferase